MADRVATQSRKLSQPNTPILPRRAVATNNAFAIFTTPEQDLILGDQALVPELQWLFVAVVQTPFLPLD